MFDTQIYCGINNKIVDVEDYRKCTCSDDPNPRFHERVIDGQRGERFLGEENGDEDN